MEHLLQPYTPTGINRLAFVSILIFMEHLLQHAGRMGGEDQYICFNPYFYGTSTSTLLFLEDAYLREMFQSLFLWNIYFNSLYWIIRRA